jgi:protein SCO1/2
MKTPARVLGLVILALFLMPSAGRADGAAKESGSLMLADKGPDLTGVGITEKLGSKIDLNHTFFDETGKKVRLGDFFAAKRPVILSLAYYECPMLCGVILNALVDGMKGLDWTPGKEFALVNVSFDPREKFDLAAAKKKNLIAALGKPEAAAGWHFLTGEENQIKSLASELGFGYRWDEKEKQFEHAAGIFVLTPDGKISRVLYGIQYRPSDLRLALLEASNGKIGTVVDRILLFCFHYNSNLRKYSVTVMKVVQIGAVLTTLLLGGFIAFARAREKRNKK